MKNLFLAVLLTLAIASSTYAADGNKVNPLTQQRFSIEFGDATNVRWSTKANFAKAEFLIEGKQMEAYYDLAGNMIGSSKKIDLQELPTIAKRQFAKKYADYTVTEAIRFEGVDEGAYFISAENSGNSVILRVTDSGSVTTFKKVIK